MKAIKKFSFIFLSLTVVFIITCFSIYLINLHDIKAIFDASVLYMSDLEVLQNKTSNKLMSTNVNLETSNKSMAKIEFKLFDIFKIKTKTVEVVNDREVLLSGDLIAMQLKPEGVFVTKIHEVETMDNNSKVFDGNIMVGDIITSVNGNKIEDICDLQDCVVTGEPIVLTILRNGKKIDISATPKLEKSTEIYRLGLTVEDDIGGIGTLTFIDLETNKFGALGHSINKNASALKSGKIVKANIIGIEKGSLGKAGEIKAYESFGKENTLGEVNKCSNKGVFGVIKNKDFINKCVKMQTGGRFSVVPGDAQIICDLDGTGAKAYNIKIIKAAKQNSSDIKGMVIKVTDKKLLSKTGGIVQGMSGSPIVQNGKLIGAVTHVFLNDSTKGYGKLTFNS